MGVPSLLLMTGQVTRFLLLSVAPIHRGHRALSILLTPRIIAKVGKRKGRAANGRRIDGDAETVPWPKLEEISGKLLSLGATRLIVKVTRRSSRMLAVADGDRTVEAGPNQDGVNGRNAFSRVA
jgi:hypothetical protein